MCPYSELWIILKESVTPFLIQSKQEYVWHPRCPQGGSIYFQWIASVQTGEGSGAGGGVSPVCHLRNDVMPILVICNGKTRTAQRSSPETPPPLHWCPLLSNSNPLLPRTAHSKTTSQWTAAVKKCFRCFSSSIILLLLHCSSEALPVWLNCFFKIL